MLSIVGLAIIVEGIVEYFKTIFNDGKLAFPIIGAIVLGIVVSVAYGLDILAGLGLETQVPYLGNLLTGIMISRGSNYVSDLLGKLNITK